MQQMVQRWLVGACALLVTFALSTCSLSGRSAGAPAPPEAAPAGSADAATHELATESASGASGPVLLTADDLTLEQTATPTASQPAARLPTPSPPPTRTMPVPSEPAEEAMPDLTRLTEPLAFSSYRDGNFEIYLLDASSATITRLTTHPATDEHATWSPDGAQMAFATNRDGNFEIYVLGMENSGQTSQVNLVNLVNLTSHPDRDSEPAWSPDGTRIAFTSTRSENPGDIYVMNADGSNTARLTDHPATDRLPVWSPDSSRIAFTSDREGGDDIYVMNADGSNVVRLTTHPDHDYAPDWAPDGSRIVFVSSRSGSDDIYMLPAAVLDSPDSPDSTEPISLTASAASDTSPVWSPDGTQVAFVSTRGGNPAIYVMNADGSEQARVTGNTESHKDPAWLPRPIPAPLASSGTTDLAIAADDLPAATVTHGGNFRSEPRIAWNTVIAQVCPGDQLVVLERRATWLRVRVTALADDCVREENHVDSETVGWVSSTLVALATATPAASATAAPPPPTATAAPPPPTATATATPEAVTLNEHLSGQWSHSESDWQITLYEDGTATSTSAGATTTGSYRMVDSEHVELALADISGVFAFHIIDQHLFLTSETGETLLFNKRADI